MNSKHFSTTSAAANSNARGRRFGRGAFLVVLALGAGITGGYASQALADSNSHATGAAHDPARMEAHVNRMVKRLAAKVDATPEQQQKLEVIAKSAMADLAPIRAKMRDARRRGMALLAAPQVDRAALEQVRQEQMALTDSRSKRLSQALADAAEVLTPPQRMKLAEHAQKFGERFGHRGFSHHGERS